MLPLACDQEDDNQKAIFAERNVNSLLIQVLFTDMEVSICFSLRMENHS